MTHDPIHDERLLLLAGHLERVPSKAFDYTEYVSHDWDGSSSIGSCGTVACALGWATTIPELRALGLTLVRRRGGWLPRLVDPATHVEHEHFRTCAILFGLDADEANLLFMPSWQSRVEGWPDRSPPADASAADVAAHIRRFVAFRRARSS